jgi:hypothetical protein
MQAIVTALLALVQIVVPGASAGIIANVIQVLTALVPIIINEYQALAPIVQNVIDVLRQSDDVTDDQWTALDAMSAQLDAAFQASLATAKAQDAAVKK